MVLSKITPAYLLNCSVCREEFISKQKWMEHLTQDGHQNLARTEFVELGNRDLSNNLKDCSLVIFTSYDLTVEDGEKIVQYFGTRSQTTLVTDFVWWTERPRIGIIQFESRKKLDEVLLRLTEVSDDLLIDSQRVQVKRSADLLDLELSALLPGNHKKTENIIIESLAIRKRGRESQDEDLPHSKKNCEFTSPSPLPPPSKAENSSLQCQYLSIRKLVVIPNHQLSLATEAVSSLKALFNDPSAEISVFRTWYLKLSTILSSSLNTEIGTTDHIEDLVVYLYSTISPPEFPFSYSWIPRERICKLIFDIEKRPDLKDFTILDKDPDDYTWKLRYTGSSSSSIPIRLISHKQAMAEVQICRIYKYMMTFDPRIEHVLSLLYFWSGINGVTIGTSNLNKKNCHLSLPEPLTMQWLLMHFMCNRKYVPTVREIQKRPHPVLRERLKGIDIGFDEDPKFVEEWKMTHGLEGKILNEDLVESVIQLVLEFFEFCWMTLDGNLCIFNTKDGEVIKTESFLNGEPGMTKGKFEWTTKMTKGEVQLLWGMQNGTDDQSSRKLYKVDLRKWNLYMVHPFIFNFNFSVNWDIGFVVKLMKISGDTLRKFLNKKKCGGVETAVKRFGKLENVLRVDEISKEKIRQKMGTKKGC